MSAHGRPIRVLEGYAGIKPTTNPYITQVDAALRATEGLTVSTFTARRALTGGYDLLHLHWPENLFGGHSLEGRVARRALTTLILLRLTLTRTPIVRTTHNLHRPSGLAWYDHRLLDWIDRLTRVQIRLNDATDLPVGRVVETIPHGHYREWYARLPRATAVPGRIGYIGLIRRYKGVEDLLRAFHDLDDEGATLRVTGQPSTTELADTVTSLAEQDPRISLRLEYVDDAAFVEELSSASLVVMPYLHMHNSGVSLAALSLDRPILVPDTPVNRALAAEVGARWVHLFEDRVDASDLARALDAAAAIDASDRPNLAARDWSDAGRAHLRAFLAATGRGGPT
ncbi:GDP-mannose:glycolipid 4-beta-D-mannosyltransferase [Aeromicrobium flavum]|uniref:GDP-mannose:glycolipid 4-beta-D-mannosyltransferase n=1 Tax=Aeromicrobium flavum TaxID=416568 RepID=A0A512HWI9_9ACTN|nr:glycosyltransferase [Aeromicrobium flavum]GEO89816.1 GDP-mannose:glycolipid 4-beta-D-mannosyltransferase [Aeromicrobium flavum]